jgi:hyperosmotically inducible protein
MARLLLGAWFALLGRGLLRMPTRTLRQKEKKMKLSILIACGAMAACSSNKPAEDPAEFSHVEAPATAPSEPMARADDRPDDRAAPAAPRSEPLPGAIQNNPPRADAPPGPAPPPPVQEPAASNAPATMAAAGAPRSEPDNTRVNKRDQGSAAPTPMDQGNGSADLKITQQIRQAVVADSSLSFTAKNVKIITSNGKVTLRGPVNSDQERQAIEASARKVAGATNVDNQLEVKK